MRVINALDSKEENWGRLAASPTSYLTGKGATALAGGVRNAEFKDKATNSKEDIRREVFVSNLFKITEERTVLMVCINGLDMWCLFWVLAVMNTVDAACLLVKCKIWNVLVALLLLIWQHQEYWSFPSASVTLETDATVVIQYSFLVLIMLSYPAGL